MRARGSTVIVMAHRPSAIAAVSKVMLLHNGAVAQFGPKEEVMQPSGRMPAAAAAPTDGASPTDGAAAEAIRLRGGVRA
jgi:ABC-type protease/lipase transport system fused ATPase/permease subunit